MIEVMFIAAACVVAACLVIWLYRLVNSWGGARATLSTEPHRGSAAGEDVPSRAEERKVLRFWNPPRSGGAVRKPWGW